jgi:hypothetical protein
MPILKIGILIRKFETLENWELRIIDHIQNDPNLELALIITNDFKNKKVKRFSLSRFFWNIQVSFEKKRYLKFKESINRNQIIEYLESISTIDINSKKMGDSRVLEKVKIEEIKNYNLDIILNYNFKNLSGDILGAAKNGIWYLYHTNCKNKTSKPVGFQEVLDKNSIVSVSLLQLTNLNKIDLIDKAYFNRHKFSYIETNFNIVESSISLLFKNIRKIQEGNELKIKEEDIHLIENFKSPTILEVIKYQSNFYSNFGKGFFNKLSSKFGIHKASWSLFLGKGNFLDADLTELIPVNKPNDEFWADPFLFEYKSEMYVFFEKFPFATQRGIISCGKIEGSNLVDVVDVLDLPYHLSYPFIFEEEGEIYMMPETNANNRLEIYKCAKFPNKWELYSTAFEGEKVADSFFYTDNNEQKWLFLNKSSGPETSLDNELYIYKVDSIKLHRIESHKQNPIYIDTRVARNGGAIFTYNNQIYRPSQRNIDGIYGKALNINRIDCLTIDDYIENTVKIIEPNSQKRLKGIHHLHQTKNYFIFDGVIK